jgi:hypothetical protein
MLKPDTAPRPPRQCLTPRTSVNTASLAVPATAETTTVHLGPLPTMLSRAALMIVEIVVVPATLLYLLVSAGHPVAGLVAVFVWRSACIGGRLTRGVHVPTTCWLAFGLFLARTAGGIAVSSVSLYLLVPVVLCTAQGLFFLGSAFTRRPVMMRLVGDYTADIPDAPELRRLFAQLSAIWGAAHVVCAAAGGLALTLPDAQSVAATGVLGIVCTVASVGGCAAWGLWRGSRIPGLRIVLAHRPAHADMPAHAVPAVA